MAIPEEKQRLLNADICEALPSNSREYMDNIYCIPGYAPNKANEVADPNNPGEYIIESSLCMPELIQDAGIQTPPPLAVGYGRDRHFFESGAIDRSFTKNKYLNTFVARSNWHLGGPGITDKFRAASGLFWVWDEDIKNIIYLNKPAPIHGCSRRDGGGHGCCRRDEDGNKVNPDCEDIPGWTEATYGPGFDPSVNTTNRNDDDSADVSLKSPFWMLVKDNGYEEVSNTDGSKEAKGTATITLYPYNGGRVGFWSAIRDDLTNNPLGLKQKFDELIDSIFEINTPFYDHTFELKGPYRKDLLPDTSVAMHYDIVPIYNYYVPEYEYLLNSGFDEALLPNLYVLLSDETYLDYTHHITHSLSETNLDGELGNASKSLEREYSYFDTSRTPSRGTRYTNTDFNITEKMDYFKKFKEKSDINNANENVDLTPLKKKFTNILVAHSESGQSDDTPAKNIQDLKALHVKKDAFPMFVDINFSTPTSTPDDSFTEILKDSKMSCTLMKNIVKEDNPLV